jgi:hypothetical protein
MSLGRSSTVERWSPTPMGEGSTPSVPAKSCLRAIRIVSCQFHSGTLVRPASRTHDACFSRPSLACRENQAHGPLAHRRKSACVARRRCGVRAPGGPRLICAASISGDALNSYFRERGSSPWRRTHSRATLAHQEERPTRNGQVTRSTRVGGSQGSGTDPASDGGAKDNAWRSPSRPPI